jgi:hypothetical protein
LGHSIANLECDLKDRTEATCSGFTSCKSGYTAGVCFGPDEITWTSTFSGSEVHWATVSLTDKVPVASTLDLTATAADRLVTPVNTNDMIADFPSDSIFPQETGSGASGYGSILRWWVSVGIVISIVGQAWC